MKKGTIFKIIGIIIVILLFIWANQTFLHISPTTIKEWILAWGWFAPVIFLILFTVRPFVFFPSPILAFTSGLTFGFWYGLLLTYIGSSLGAIATLIVVRFFSKRFLKSSWDEKYEAVKKQIDEKGFLYLLILRLIPILNFDFVSYAAAFSSIRFKDYFIATLIGIIPGAILYTLLGTSVQSKEGSMITLSLTLLSFVLITPFLFKEKMKKLVGFTKVRKRT